MEKVVLYSSHCPQCIMLENLLRQKKIDYDYISVTIEDVVKMGFESVPLLEVNGKIMSFHDARSWVNKKK